jgi:hypothetical protein
MTRSGPGRTLDPPGSGVLDQESVWLSVTGASLPAVELLLSSVQLGFALVEPEVPLVEEASCSSDARPGCVHATRLEHPNGDREGEQRESPRESDDNQHVDHLDGAAITSLYFGGSPDVAALVADQAGWGFASAGLLTHQTFGTASTRHGGQAATPDPLAERAFRLACQDITELLLDPTVSGRRRVASLDEPEDALAVLRRLGDAGAGDRPADARSPLVMLRISSLRLRWVANREVVNTRSGTWNDDSVVATHRRLLRLQDELTRAVEAAPGRPTVVLDVPESAADYDDSERDTTDEDFDTYVTVSGRIREWLTGLRDMGPPAG